MIKFEKLEINSYPTKLIYKEKKYKIIKHQVKSHFIRECLLVKETLSNGKTYLKNVLVFDSFHYNTQGNLLLHKNLHSSQTERGYYKEHCFELNSRLREEVRDWILTYDVEEISTTYHSNDYPWQFIETDPPHNISSAKLTEDQQGFYNNFNNESYEICDGSYFPSYIINNGHLYDIEILPNFEYRIMQFVLIFHWSLNAKSYQITDVILGGYHPNANLFTGEICMASVNSFKKESSQNLANKLIPQYISCWNFDDGYQNAINLLGGEIDKQFRLINPRKIILNLNSYY